MPFHKGARSPLYRRQISSPCISRISGIDTRTNVRHTSMLKMKNEVGRMSYVDKNKLYGTVHAQKNLSQETKAKKQQHTCHQKMQGLGSLRALLMTERRWEGLYLYHRTTGRKLSLENYHLNPSWAV